MSNLKVFETGYAKNNQETLRWASVAIAGFLVLVALIFCVVIATKSRFQNEMGAGGSPDSKPWRMLGFAFFFLFVIASTFLSWYVAALHMSKNYLIALDVLNFVIAVFLGFAAYFYYRNNDPMPGYASGFLFGCLIMELVAFVVLIVAPQAALQAGTTVQTCLYIPLVVTTLALMGRLVIPGNLLG